MLMRFAKERKKNNRKAKFDLDDSDNEGTEIKLTHKGQAIDDLDLNDEPRHKGEDSDDDEDRKFLDDEMVNKLHFGGEGLEDSDDDELLTVKKTRD